MIEYKTHFWDFYTHNKKDIDKIISSVIYKYSNLIDLHELKNQLLYDLSKSDMLSRFDQSKSHIQTYLYQRIEGYTKHIIERLLNEKKYLQTLENYNAVSSKENNTLLFDIFCSIKKNLTNIEWGILSKHIKGWKFIDIAKEYNVSPTLISKKYEKIKEIIRKELE